MDKIITVNIDELYLDPNNPRLAEDFEFSEEKASLKEIVAFQDRIIDRFYNADSENVETDEFFDISGLRESFKKIGFVDLDRILCLQQEDGKYLVLEGNRRTTALKVIKKIGYDEEDISEEIRPSLQNIPITLIDSEGRSPQEINNEAKVLLGIRHHGSLKSWAPLPSAHNVYETYLNYEPKQEQFEYYNSRALSIASILSISKGKVKSRLVTYIAYNQLKEMSSGVQPHHFSLIQAVIENGQLKNYFNIESDSKTLKIPESGLEKIDLLCEFATRDKISDNKKKLKNPQKVATLARLIKGTALTNETLRECAKNILQQYLDGEKPLEAYRDENGIVIQGAIEEFTTLVKQCEWVKALKTLIEKKDVELKVENYESGNDKLQKETLSRKVNMLKAAMGI
jgi:hypothetical protein